MPLQQIVGLPLVDDSLMNVQLRIQAHGQEYLGYIQTDFSDWCSFPIQLTLHDIVELNTELQQVIESVSSYFDTDEINVIERREILSNLARKGNFAFKKVFAKGTPRDIVNEALKMGGVIQITSEDFCIPWELLYNGPLSNEVDPYNFWGMQHVISRTLIREARPGDFAPPVITSRPHVGLVACQELEHVMQKEIPTLKKFQELEQIHLSFLHTLDSQQRDKELADFGRFLNEEVQIIHLACHACERNPPSESYLLVSTDFSISMEDFEVQEFEIEHKPLVFLNACLSGTVNPLYTSNWATLFWRHGARGVLATEFHVPDWFASAFIEELYKQLLNKRPLGESLLMARRHFLDKQYNPLGLGYALYARPSIRIAK